MRVFWRSLGDLLRGLFGFPGSPQAGDHAAALEERYRGTGRCC